jgi:hypothetical protein
MQYSFDFDGGPQDLTITVSGSVDALGIRDLVRDLTAHPEFRAGLMILADLSGLDTSNFTTEDYEQAEDAVAARDWQYPARAVALVAPDPRTFSDATLYRAYVGGATSGREVFKSRDEATQWLQQQQA